MELREDLRKWSDLLLSQTRTWWSCLVTAPFCSRSFRMYLGRQPLPFHNTFVLFSPKVVSSRRIPTTPQGATPSIDAGQCRAVNTAVLLAFASRLQLVLFALSSTLAFAASKGGDGDNELRRIFEVEVLFWTLILTTLFKSKQAGCFLLRKHTTRLVGCFVMEAIF